MKVSMAIMAHPKREHHVKELQKKLPGVPVIWDEINDRWHTGRRAMLAFDPDADKHLVVQDDAILCRHFVDGVEKALEQVPEVPASFYTGKTQPFAAEVKRAVDRAQENNKHWFSMQGPLWGVAIAIPTNVIEEMVAYCDGLALPNYDLRITEFFQTQGVDCWYSIPSLVNHRVGPENPSLVPERMSSMRRTAHAWIGKKDPRKIDWKSGCLPWMDLSKRKWARLLHGYGCGACGEMFERLADVISHNFDEHSLGPVDFIATDPNSVTIMETIMGQMEPGARGKLWVIGKGGVRPLSAKRVLSKQQRRFTIADTYDASKYAIGRPVWTMDNKAEING